MPFPTAGIKKSRKQLFYAKTVILKNLKNLISIFWWECNRSLTEYLQQVRRLPWPYPEWETETSRFIVRLFINLKNIFFRLAESHLKFMIGAGHNCSADHPCSHIACTAIVWQSCFSRCIIIPDANSKDNIHLRACSCHVCNVLFVAAITLFLAVFFVVAVASRPNDGFLLLKVVRFYLCY